jgi:molybdopterin molybdotransferase
MANPPLRAASADAVWRLLAEQVSPGPNRTSPVAQALGCVLAEVVVAQHDYPPFDRAAMDGYAVRAADFAARPATLRRIGLARAGLTTAPLAAGCCIQINTGAPLPEGADAVVVIEKSRELPDDRVELDDAPRGGQHIERRAALARRGQTVVPAGTRIRPGTLAAIVSAGVSTVCIYERPRVALLTTGDELAPAGESLAAGQIPESNSVALAELIRRCGAEPLPLGRSLDEPEQLRDRLRAGLVATMLCVTGGMSKGSHDLVPSLLEALGVNWLVTSLDLKPGKPMRIGRGRDGAWVVGLPGNPVSCVVCFLLFVRCILDGLQGLAVRPPPLMTGRCTADLPKNGERPMYHPAMWTTDADAQPVVTPVAWRGSGDPFGLAVANALLTRPADAPAAAAGSAIRFVPVDTPP